MKKLHLYQPFLFTVCLALAACGTGIGSADYKAVNAHYKVGQPYQVEGQWYYPREDYSYDETGIASWYGADFHDHLTANGEIYNKNELTAAHKTLPLPSLARITNLDNGRSIVVRVNDRGPFSGTRIIDLSQRAAQLLGFEAQGTAKVRVQVLADESKAIADAMRHYGKPAEIATGPSPEMAAPVQNAAASAKNGIVISPSAAPATTQPVESETLSPVRTTEETHRQLLATKPVQEVVQVPVTGHTQLFIQAGAFTVQGNAQRLQQNLSRFGQTAISEIVINGTKFYRVRVGPVVDVPHADALLSQVKQVVPNARTVVD